MTHSFDWLRQLKPELKSFDSIPLTGSPPFPWDDLSARLAKVFECDSLTIHSTETLWRTQDQLLENLGTAPNCLTFNIPALKGEAYWLMPEQEIALLENFLLTKESHPLTNQDQSLKESFYRFLILETLYAISQTSFDQALIPVLSDKKTLPVLDALCMDITITIQGRPLLGRLVISPKLQRSWANYFIRKGSSWTASEQAKKIAIPVHLEIGRTELAYEDWEKVAPGDFMMLDSCYLKEDGTGGEIVLTVQGKPAFKGEIVERQINILELL